MKNTNLLIQEPPLLVLPSLATTLGLNEAIVVQQLHYWLENPKVGIEKDGIKWVFNTYEEWHENFPFWSVATIQRIFSSLEKMELVISRQLDAKKHDMKKFYRLDYDKLCKMDHIKLRSSDHSKMESSNTSNSDHDNKNTETTPETTRDTKENLQKIISEANASFDKELELMRLSAGKSWTKLPEAYHAYGKAFCAATGLEYVKKNLYDWIGVFEEWNAQSYMPQDVIAAVQAITDEGRAGTISAPRSITHKLNGIKVARITRERALQAKVTPEENGEPDWREQWALEQANRENVSIS